MEASIENNNLDELIDVLSSDPIVLPTFYHSFSPEQWAYTIESLPNELRLLLWPHIDDTSKAAVLSELHDDTKLQFMSVLSRSEIEETVVAANANDAVEILEVLPKRTASKIIQKLNPEDKVYVETSLSYGEDEVGRYAEQQVYTLNAKEIVDDVIKELKDADEVIEAGYFIVVDAQQQLVGELGLNELLAADKNSQIAAIASPPDSVINDKLSLLEASKLVRNSHRQHLPVVSDSQKFIGIFSIQDALDIFEEFYESQLAHMGQVSDEDLFSPVFTSARKRAIWLGINLMTAFLASAVIGLFDRVLVEVVALAVLMPIVASMGGITGSQSLTLTIRGLATGQISLGNLLALRNKEFNVALINGVVWAVAVALICFYWFDSTALSLVISLAIIINMLVAAFAGVYIPVYLKKVGVDPAIAGSVILTTVTDVVGFFVFLGAASIVFLS